MFIKIFEEEKNEPVAYFKKKNLKIISLFLKMF